MYRPMSRELSTCWLNAQSMQKSVEFVVSSNQQNKYKKFFTLFTIAAKKVRDLRKFITENIHDIYTL